MTASDSYQRIYTVVSMVPRGRVATYGQIAELAGLPRQARLVGYALNVLPKGSRVPWHRIINSQGKISLRVEGEGSDNPQMRLLKREKVKFNQQGVIDLKVYRWEP